jgi:hypothetical protein
MNNIGRLARSLILALTFCSPGLVAAATTWSCWYNLDQQVACLLREAAPDAPLSLHESRTLESARPIHRPTAAAFLPPSVQLLRSRPGAFRGRTLYIPIYNEPIDHRMVQVLAQAVMCGADPSCRATYGERPAATLEMAEDFADANDPLLQAMES